MPLRGHKAEFSQPGPLFKVSNHEKPRHKTSTYTSPFNVGVYQGSKGQALDQPASLLNKPGDTALCYIPRAEVVGSQETDVTVKGPAANKVPVHSRHRKCQSSVWL